MTNVFRQRQRCRSAVAIERAFLVKARVQANDFVALPDQLRCQQRTEISFRSGYKNTCNDIHISGSSRISDRAGGFNLNDMRMSAGSRYSLTATSDRTVR